MIDINKKYRTRDGREVRIYAVELKGERPVHGAVFERIGEWVSRCWSAKGRLCGGDATSDYDIIEVKPRIRREVWLNVYHERDIRTGAWYSTKEEADKHQAPVRKACIKITIDCEEGEGL